MESGRTPLLYAVKKLGPNRVRYLGTPHSRHVWNFNEQRTVWMLDGKRHATMSAILKAADVEWNPGQFGMRE